MASKADTESPTQAGRQQAKHERVERKQSAASQLLARLECTRGFERHPWPDAPVDDDGAWFAMVLLSEDEQQQCYAAGLARFAALKISTYEPVNAIELHNEISMQLLARSMRVLKPGASGTCAADGTPTDERWFETVEEYRETVKRPDVRDQLVNWYSELLDVAPSLDDLAPDEYEAVAALVKKKDAQQLAALPSRILARYLSGTASPSES